MRVRDNAQFPFTMSQIRDIVEISSESLPSLDHVTGLVQDDGAGAITTFSGTTRNVFEGVFDNEWFQVCAYQWCQCRQSGG